MIIFMHMQAMMSCQQDIGIDSETCLITRRKIEAVVENVASQREVLHVDSPPDGRIWKVVYDNSG